MKKNLLCLAFGMLSLGAFAQDPIILDDKEVSDLDIDSLETIVGDINEHVERTTTNEDEKKAWSRKTFLRLSYTKGKMELNTKDLSPVFMNDKKYPMLDGTNDEMDLYNLENDYGFSLINGRNYFLHKKAIAKMLKFAIDYTWIDLCYNHYKGFYSKDGMKYDPNKTFATDDNKSYHYSPWGMEMHEANYGMSIGPSLTIAPLGLLDNDWRNLQIQTYFHVGYSVSAIMMMSKDNMRLSTGSDSGYYGYKDPTDETNFQLATGVTTSWGINLSWKGIGVGMETRKAPMSYKSMKTSTYGNEKIKMDYKDTRFYINFRF